ncbi:MAG: FlxA-like family protein, partial [Lachnospiraceae bacterium]|nr:FlxA-like family protein [Lachnospiraceae bacterium]
MTIGGIGGNRSAGSSAVSMGSNGTDSYSKSLQKQIADAQKQLQELSGNEEMSAEIKMKKRQEIQKQISDLNMQLRQHQMEERRKAQQEKQAKRQPKKEQEKQTGLSKGSME